MFGHGKSVHTERNWLVLQPILDFVSVMGVNLIIDDSHRGEDDLFWILRELRVF